MPVVVNGIEMDRGLIEELREGAGGDAGKPEEGEGEGFAALGEFV